MVAAFGTTGGTRGHRWRDHEMLESLPVLRPGGLLGVSEVIVAGQRIEITSEWWGGRRPRQRPKFCCPCGRTCKYLYRNDGRYTCRLCCVGYDYRSRHRRFNGGPALGRVVRLRRQLGAEPWLGGPLPPRPKHHVRAKAKYDRLLPLIEAAEAEVLAHLAKVVGDLDTRVKRLGKK